MIEQLVRVTCNKCGQEVLFETDVMHSREVRELFARRRNNWIETTHEEHVCPLCKPDWQDMRKKVHKIEPRVWLRKHARPKSSKWFSKQGAYHF